MRRICTHTRTTYAAPTRGEVCKRLKVVDVELHVALRCRDRQIELKGERRAHAVDVMCSRRRLVCSRTALVRADAACVSYCMGRHARVFVTAMPKQAICNSMNADQQL